MEIVANGMALLLARDSGVYAPLTNATWLATVDRLSRRLSPGQLMTVAGYYHYVGAIRGRGFPVAGAPDAELQKVASEAVRAFAEAAMLLEEVGWSEDERGALRKARDA